MVGECVGPSDTHDHAACGAKRADGSPIRLWGISRRVAQLGPHSKNRGSLAQMSVPLGRNGTEPVRVNAAVTLGVTEAARGAIHANGA